MLRWTKEWVTEDHMQVRTKLQTAQGLSTAENLNFYNRGPWIDEIQPLFVVQHLFQES